MYSDYVYLAAELCGMQYDEEGGLNYEDLEESMLNQFNIDLPHFEELAERLIRYTMPVQSPLSGGAMHLFGKFEDNESGAFIAIVHVVSEPRR